MKHILLLTLGIAALSLVGCTQDVEVIVPESPRADGAMEIKIDGRIDHEYATRVDDGGFCDGDQVGLYGVNYTDNNATAGTLLDEGNQVDNARYTFDEETHTWSSSGNIYYKDAETNIDIYAYYPYARPESVSAYKFEVAEDQSGVNALDGFAQSDFLWAKAESVTPSEAKVKLHFTHRLSSVNVNLVEGEGFAEGEFAGLKKSVLVMNTTRTAEIDLSTGVATPTGEAASEGIVTKYNAEGFRAIVVPQLVGAGKSLLSITVDGISYRFKKDVDFVYEAGKMTKFEITINKKEHTGEYEFVLTATDIVDWVADLDSNGGEARQYYVVHLDEAGMLEAKLNEAKKDPAKIKNLKVAGKINAGDIYFMRDKMEALQAINIKECEIVACWLARVDLNDGRGIHYEAFTGDMPESDEDRINALNNRFPEASYIYVYDYMVCGAHEIPNEAFIGKTYLSTFIFPDFITKIGDNAFSDTLFTGALILPDSVTEIGDRAFNNCIHITSLTLPSSLKTVGYSAFGGCRHMQGSLNLSQSLEYIGPNAFNGCGSLTGKLHLPESLNYIGEGAFGGCSGFRGDLIIPESISALYSRTFGGCGFNGSLIMHDNLELIGGINGGIFEGAKFQGELTLPKNIKSIPDYCFKDCLFTSIAELPDGLLEIGYRAFFGCRRLGGTLEFPESILKIGDDAFSGGSAMFNYVNKVECIILPANIAVIGYNAFSGSYYVTKIVCKATEPPIAPCFGYIHKDNCVVEVPESAIARYKTDSNWGEFKKIVANYDFTISRRLMRTLSAEHSREFVLRAPANYAWSIESCPEWVTVTPSSGVGKTEVTVTVAEMTAADVGSFEINTGSYESPIYETHEGRAAEVVFLLNDKDARVTLDVEQYDYEYNDSEVIVNQTATKGGGINLVFMGDCFDARDIAMGSYINGINEAIEHYFAIEPYKTYRDYFNVYTVVGLSNDSGMGTINTVRDAKFGSQYTLNEGVSPDETTIFEYAMKAETVNENNLGQSLVVLIENTTAYGGTTCMWGDGSAVAICPMSTDAYPYDYRGIIQHYAGGCGFGKLGSELLDYGQWLQNSLEYQQYLIGKSLGWYRNLEEIGNVDKVAWSHLIFHPDYSNVVDIFEGGFFCTRGVFRSESVCCMNLFIPYYSAISRQEIVERIKRYAGEEFDINDFYANDVLDIQGNAATRSAIDESLVTSSGAGKQMPPRFMGDKPQLKKNNK